MSRSLVRTVVAILVMATVPVLPAAAGNSAGPTANGHRCTIVGTPRADVLRGTSRRDVICGRGGNDRILGRGGDDLILGGGGDDRLIGGAGRDTLKGGAGVDRLDGGSSDDRLSGGWGGDTIAGRSGDDDLDGDPGDDKLDGGPGADDLDGGPGNNACVPDGADTQTACRFDLERPVVLSISANVSTVDVSDQDQHVLVSIRATDDTGLNRVSVSAAPPSGGSVNGAMANLSSGTRRNGTWVAEIVFPQWSQAGTFVLEAFARDTVGRSPRTYLTTTLEVVSSVVDEDLPRSQLIAPTDGTRYDARATAREVPVTVRVTDELSGVLWVYVCLYQPMEERYQNKAPCVWAGRTSGTAHDGIYQATVTIPAGALGGTWNLGTDAGDRAHGYNGQRRTVGPDVLSTEDPTLISGFPGGRGRITVIGVADTHPPSIESVTMSTRTISTLNGPGSVVVTARARDFPGEGVLSVYLYLWADHDSGSGNSEEGDLTRVSGTVSDGLWRATLTLPQGTPPGTYYLRGWVEDRFYYRNYIAPGTSQSGNPDELQLVGDTFVTVAGD